jgi:hypothetical protein
MAPVAKLIELGVLDYLPALFCNGLFCRISPLLGSGFRIMP